MEPNDRILPMRLDPKGRFSNRAQYYDAFRPKYPKSLLTYLQKKLLLSQLSVIADVGSGTGIFTELLLKNGNTVFAVEPNEDMRKKAEAKLSVYPNFKSVNGSAESTTLPDKSVDFVTAAQSFHWFRLPAAKVEFFRILRLNGWVVFIWNTRKTSTPFLQAYEDLVTWISGETKKRVRHEDFTGDAIADFLGKYETVKLQSSQELDLEGLIGRLMSASYSPLPGDSLHPEFIRRATDLFNCYQQNGFVGLRYETEVNAGKLYSS